MQPTVHDIRPLFRLKNQSVNIVTLICIYKSAFKYFFVLLVKNGSNLKENKKKIQLMLFFLKLALPTVSSSVVPRDAAAKTVIFKK
jgi:hypothetical protein